MSYCGVPCLVSKYLNISVTDSFIDSFVVNSIFCMTLILFKCIKNCFMVQKIVYLDNCSMCNKKKCIFCCCWVWCSKKINGVKLIDCVGFFFFYIFNYFLCYYIYYWEKSNKIVDYNYGFVYFSLKLCHFYFMHFELLFLGANMFNIVMSFW